MRGAHNTNIALNFYNDRVKEAIDDAIVAEPFTYIPITAGHMELVGGNALVFGKIKEGYDVIAIDVTHEITYEDKSLDNPIVSLLVALEQAIPITWVYYNMGEDGLPDPHPVDKSIWDGTQSWKTIHGVAVVVLPFIITEGSIYSITVLNTVEGLNYTVSYTALHGDTYVEVKAGLIAELVAEGEGDEIEYGIPGVNKIYFYARDRAFMDVPVQEAASVDIVYANFTITAHILSFGYASKYPQLKSGSVQSYGIVYKDRSGRVCSVIKSSDLDVYIPFYTELDDNDLNKVVKVKFKLWHRPPDWAESYEIVWFGNISMDYFMQMRIANIASIGSNRYSVNIVDTLQWTRDKNNRWKVDDYTWQEGDRMRLMGTIDVGTGVTTKYNTLYDYEIESTGTQYNEEAIGGDWLIMQAVDHPTPFVNETNILTEVYRPRKGLGNTVPYGTGMVFGVGTDANGNKYHKGDVDQSLSTDTPAEINNTANDCWKFIRLNYQEGTAIIQPFWAESIFPSDWWGGLIIANKLTSNGFPFLDDLSQKQVILDERFRFGGTLIAGSRTNNIAHFTYLNFRDLQKKHGDITGLREIGFTLKAIQLYKETSIYINRVQSFNPDGTSQFILTDSFIGDIRPMEDSYGCQHPDSVMVNGRNLYYWDNSQGVFVRSSPNGQVVLDTKMKRYFKDIVKWIGETGGKDALVVNVGANNEHEEIWITFRLGTETRGLIYSEKDNRYKSRIDQVTESYVHLGNFFAHLYKQSLWIMNIDEGQGYLTWAGVPTYGEIEIGSNVDPMKNKIFNACAIITDHELISESRSVVIPEEASANNEIMESNIPLWERKEGIFFGKIMKDENSKGNFASVLARKMNGREMRGRYAFVKFKTEEHDEKVRINSITVFSTPSERNI